MGWEQWLLIGFIALLIIAYPILVSSRNKKENQKLQEQTNSLKRGDKILTTSGVYGTIVDLQMDENKKIVTIETGNGAHKSYMAVDAYAIYTVFRDENKAKADEQKSKTEKDAKKPAAALTDAKENKKDEKSDKNDEKVEKMDEKTEKDVKKPEKKEKTKAKK